jgi:hypothetical protein
LKVSTEKGPWVTREGVSTQDDGVPFKEFVGLVARQKKMKRSFVDDDRVSLREFSGVPEVVVFGPGKFAQTH